MNDVRQEPDVLQAGEHRRALPAWVPTALRAAVSVAAIGIILTRVPLPEIAAAIIRLYPAWTAAAFLAVFAAIGISAMKWGVLLRARGYTLRLSRLLRHYLVGLFFNNFLPTSVGGDVIRAAEVGGDLSDVAEGAASVISERLIASLTLGITASLALPFVAAGMRAVVAVLVVVVASVVLVTLFLLPSRAEPMMERAMGGRFAHVMGWVSRAVGDVRETLRHYPHVTLALVLSVAFQVCVALVNFAIFRALGTPVSLGACIVYTSVVSAVTMVPISISGHGVREAGYAYFFGLAGVPEDVAVTASLLFFVVVALATLPGGILFMTGKRRS